MDGPGQPELMSNGARFGGRIFYVARVAPEANFSVARLGPEREREP